MQTKTDQKLGKAVIKALVKSFYSNGTLTDKDLNLSHDKFFKKILAILDSSELAMIVDHRQSILKQAQSFALRKNFDYSRVFYAMFFEHTINGIIKNLSSRQKIPIKMTMSIVRSVDIYGKFTWLLKLFGCKDFNPKHLQTIKKLADNRNAFIHYKWNEGSDELEEQVKNSINEEFASIALAIRYMKSYESNVNFAKNKKSLLSKLKS